MRVANDDNMTQTITISTASGRRKRKRKKHKHRRWQKKLDALWHMGYTYLKLTEYTSYIGSSYVQSPFVVYLTCVGNQIL